MSRKGVTGTDGASAPRRDSNGFVNRRPSVQSRPPATKSENSAGIDERRARAASALAHRAALAAGRRPVDFQQFGAVDRAVLAEIARFQRARARFAAALIPYLSLGGAL